MQTRQQLVFDSIKSCLIELGDSVYQRREIAALRAQLQKASDEIGALSLTQFISHGSRRGDGGQIIALRRDLRRRLLRISSLAVVALEGLPGIEDDVRVPHANAKNDELLEAAARILTNLRPHRKTLYSNGLTKDSINRVEAVARALGTKSGSSDTAIARRSRATSSLPEALRRARKIVRAIDTTVKVEFASETSVLQAWAGAQRIPRKTGRPKTRRNAASKARPGSPAK